MNLIEKIASKKHLLGATLLISVVLGPAVAYGSIYLFHIVLAALIFIVAFSNDLRTQFLSILKKPLNTIFLIALFWLTISIFWAENTSYALNHVVQFTMGLMVIMLCQVFIDSKATFKFHKNNILFPLLLVVLAIGLLESFTDFRWPISSISYHNELFGRENVVVENLKTERIAGYLLASPTAFFWNPNHLAVFLCFFIPFFMKRKWNNYLVFVIIVVVITQTGSRLTSIALAAILMLFSFINRQNIRFLLLYLATLFLPMMFFASSLLAIKANEPLEKITGVHMLSKVCIICPDSFYLPDENDNSQSVRRQLYAQGFQYLKDSRFLGVGAGNAEWLNFKQKEKTNNVTSVHFYWLELFINGGVVLGILMLLYFSKMYVYLWKTRKNEISQYFLMALTLFGLAVISLSSAHYFLPYYAFLGLLSAWINLNTQNNETNAVAG
jgi:O-antigen ligase